MTTRFPRPALAALLAVLFFGPAPAAAQPSDSWKVDFVPFYLWAMSLDGNLSAGPRTVPIFLDFNDAVDSLGGAFTFHLEASRGRWGLLTDLNFIRLSSETEFTILNRPVQGDVDLDNTIFEVGASYLANERRRLAVIGGLRTYTLSPKLEFTGAVSGATPVDASQTSPNAFIGITLRPQLSEKWMLLSRADVGGGDGFTWSAELGVNYRFKPWAGLTAGFKGLGIDVQHEDKVVTGYDVVHYGPFFGLDFHWGSR